MKMFEFTALKLLHKDMIAKGEERATFPFEFNGKIFSCIFLTDIIPYRLYLTTLLHSKRPGIKEIASTERLIRLLQDEGGAAGRVPG